MSNYSNFLSLVLPGAGEYRDTWWEPANRNFRVIDQWAITIDQEIVNARFTQATIGDFLSVGHETTGALKPTAEMLSARNSPVYGYNDATLSISKLKPRLDSSDWEIWKAREGQTSLAAALANRLQGIKTQIISGSVDAPVAGYPDWLTVVGKVVTVNGLNTNLVLSIDGKYRRVRTNIATDLANYNGSDLTTTDGTKYLYAQITSENGEVIVDGDSLTVPPAAAYGAASADPVNGEFMLFNDMTPGGKDFSAIGVKPGDLLQIIDSDNAGLYIIKELTTGQANQLQIFGSFPVAAGISGINYNIYDPWAVAVGIDTTMTPVAGKIYIGEVVIESTAVTDYHAYHYNDTFISKWTAVDVLVDPGIIESEFFHGLNSDILDISVHACATVGGEIIELGTTTLTANQDVAITNTLSVSKSGTVVYTQPTFAPSPAYVSGTQSGAADTLSTFTPGAVSDTIDVSLSGDVTAELSGTATTDNSVKMKWGSSRIWVKNAVAGVLYTSYSGTAITSGYVRVVVRRRG